jgi:hypothetical protein
MAVVVAASIAVAAAGVLAACGGDPRVEDLASCLEGNAETAEVVEGASGSVGAINMIRPTATIHVFETEDAARAYVEQSNHPGGVNVDSGFTANGTLAVSVVDPPARQLIESCN